MQHVHSWPAYAALALTLVLLATAWLQLGRTRLTLWTGVLLGVEIVQVIVGIVQARTGLPIVLVDLHMVLAMALVAAMTAVMMHLRAPESEAAAAPPLARN